MLWHNLRKFTSTSLLTKKKQKQDHFSVGKQKSPISEWYFATYSIRPKYDTESESQKISQRKIHARGNGNQRKRLKSNSEMNKRAANQTND